MSLKKRLASALGGAMGLEIIPKSGLSGWPEANFASALFSRLGIDCVFDVGANIGQYGKELRKLGYAGTICSFEPGPAAFEQLRAAAEYDMHWHVFNYALGAEKGTLRLNVMKETALSSFLQPDVGDGQPFSDVNVVADVVQVPVLTIADKFDQLAEQYQFARPFLKMDTQGFDLEVAKGAGEKLAAFSALMSEVAVKALYADNPLLPESLTTFSSLGFDMIAMHSVHPGNLLDPHEFNCYLLRRDLAR